MSSIENLHESFCVLIILPRNVFWNGFTTLDWVLFGAKDSDTSLEVTLTNVVRISREIEHSIFEGRTRICFVDSLRPSLVQKSERLNFELLSIDIPVPLEFDQGVGSAQV